MTTLVWGIKRSLLDYARGMDDGDVTASDGAVATDDGLVFASASGLAFRGTVILTGHGGMMRVVIRDPALEQHWQGWILSIADPDDPAVRLPFATIRALEPSVDGSQQATGTALTAEGADLFFGPYVEGTPLDDPRVRA